MGINVIKAIAEVKGYFTDRHFRYKSKKHGPGYLNMDPVFPHVRTLRQICIDMARPFQGEFDAVVGAATGGILKPAARKGRSPARPGSPGSRRKTPLPRITGATPSAPRSGRTQHSSRLRRHGGYGRRSQHKRRPRRGISAHSEPASAGREMR